MAEEHRAVDKPANEQSQYLLMNDPQAILVASIITKRIRTNRDKRRSMLLEVKANVSYLVGAQDIRLVGDNIVPLDKERAITSTANVILPAVQKDVAVGTMRPPIFDIVPAGTDADDKATAITCQKLFKFIQRRIGRDLKRGEVILWYDIAGVGWRKVYYDHNAIVLGVNPKAENEDGSPNPAHIPELRVGDAIVEGEIEIETIPPNQLIWDYRNTNLKKLPWIIHAKQVTNEYVLDTFGPDVSQALSGKFNAPGHESQFDQVIENRFQAILSGTDDTPQRTSTMAARPSTEVQLAADRFIDYYEYWQKPSKSSPAGMFAIMLGDQVVLHGPYPVDQYPHGELPFIPAAPLNIAGVMNGSISRISQARPLQRELNRLRSQIGENVDVMANAIIMAPRRAKLRHKTLDNGSGNIIEYDGPVGKPTREPGVPMSGQVFSYLAETKRAIDDIFAFHEPSRGQAPRNIDSGKGILALQNADTVHMGPIVFALEEADEKVVYQALILAVANYAPGKLFNAVGTDYQWAVEELNQEQLRGKFNVIVKPHSSMPLDKDQEAQAAFDVWGSGLMGDPQDPDLRVWTMEQMHMGNIDNLLQKHSKHKNFARREFSSAVRNLKNIPQLPEQMTAEQTAAIMQQFTFIPPTNVFDDDKLHMIDHNEYLLDNWWPFKRTQNPLFFELLNNMVIHIQEHATKIQKVAQMQHDLQLRDQMLIKKATLEQITAGRRQSETSKTKGK